MKVTTKVLSGCLMLLFTVACGTKNNPETTNSEIYMSTGSETADGSQRMSASEVEREIEWNSVKYRYLIRRTPDEELTKVKDEDGQLYVDNRIQLTLTKEDGTPFFNREFTKQSFASLLDEDFLKNAVLEGMIYYQSTAAGLVFTASVSYPQSDLFVPIILTISSDGSVDMRKETSPEEFLGGKMDEE